jgi:hypothetical protein
MKKIKFYLLGLLAAGSMTSCLVDDEVDAYTSNMDYIVGFDQASATVSYFEDEGVVTNYYPISLKGSADGGTYDQDIELSVSVDQSSSAIAGQEYDFSVSNVTLAAGTDYVLLPVDINTGNFDPDVPTTLVIRIASNTDGSVVSQNYSTLTIQFVGCVSTITPGTYMATFGGQSTYYAGQSYTEEITATGEPNTFVTAQTPPFLPGSNYVPGLSNYGFNFVDVCGDITVPSQLMWAGAATNEVYGVNTTDDFLTNQQGAVIDADTFILYIYVDTDYYSYITYTRI